MIRLPRRDFNRLAAASMLCGIGATDASGQARSRVVVIGGGIGGATIARTLAASGAPVDVTMIERKSDYVSCVFSNHYLAGLCSLGSLTHGFGTIGGRDGVTVINETVAGIDPQKRRVRMENGAHLFYDRLVLATGVSLKYDGVEGLEASASTQMPHAWEAGPQSELLRRQLEAMEDGGVFLITVPEKPIRCPVGPYERASLVAHYFKRSKSKSKVQILDASDTFPYQQIFEEGWAAHYPGMIEWLPAQFTDGVKAVDVAARTVITGAGAFKAAVVNFIPAQGAGPMAEQAGLTDGSGWCPVDPATFASTLQPDIHVVGDAIAGGDMPKSAFSASSQAKACAFGIAAELTGAERARPHLFNACYTFLGPDDAFVNALTFEPNDEAGRIELVHSFVNDLGEAPDIRQRTARDGQSWYAAFMQDTFG
jgi:NADPH-dependent 2,4-dienoyl-CoA reductase/sulfur reductase-like enzyme